MAVQKKPRRPSRVNPLNLRSTPVARTLPKSANRLSGIKTKGPKLVWYKRLNPFKKRTEPFKWSWKKFFIWSGAIAAVLLVIIAALFAFYVRDLPNPRQLSERPVVESTKILDRNGKQLYNFFGEENRTQIKSDQISVFTKQATVALEDANFYTHPGIDIKGIARAVICRLPICGGRVSGGGSTITQQYVRNAALVSKAQTANRKLKEIILAVEVEQIYSKDEILTGYLNEIPYGANAYGIEAAAQTYFKKSAKDLTLSEAATLAAIPQQPTYYSPYGNNLDNLFTRKDFVLDRMVKSGFINADQAAAAKKANPSKEDPTFAPRTDLVAPHFVFFVRQQLINFLGEDPKTAEVKLDQAGFTVTTSLDMDTQSLAEGILKDMGPNVVSKYQASNAAITAVDPNNGEVLAMVGSIDYNNSKSGNTNFATANLQPGSSFKPFVYATQFDKDHKSFPAAITYDLPTDFGNYKPSNYNGQFSGPITNRNALDRSLNIPAVKNLYLAGIKNSIDTAHRMGITTLNADPGTYGLSLVLGAGEVRPVDMANAYGTFANGGTAHPLRPILKIERGGQIIKDYTTDTSTKALEPEVAYEMDNILSDNSARAPVFGTKNNLTLPDRPVSAKSGTTQSNRDGWTVGFTPQISVAVWVGNNEANKTMVKGADGSIVAAPIWNRFMREYLSGKPVVNFTRPDTITDFTVDRLSGKIPTDQSPPDQRITDIFAPWQIPTTFDDVHIKVNIDSASGKLATDLTPAENVVVQYFCKIHSEVPDNPNWESPVQGWASTNGCTSSPPTTSDDVHAASNKPTIMIVSPTNGASASGPFTIVANVGGPRPITSVQFFVNNVAVGTVTSSPWDFPYDAASLPDGSSTIEATAKNDLGLTATSQITLNKGAPAAPGPVTSVAAINGRFSTQVPIHVSWQNPATPITEVYITRQSGPGSPVIYHKTTTAGNQDFYDIPVTGLPIGPYTFTIYVKNSSGQTSSPVTFTSRVDP
jgi:penicillin-binding protein 1C